VTVTVATRGVVFVLIVVYEGIFPVPDVPKPTFTSLVQLYVVPATGLENVTPATERPPQKNALETVLTLVAGLTVTVKVVLVPTHPPTVGVTVTVAV
jgi:hypothetical protein